MTTSKIQLNHYPPLPAKCIVCGRDNKGYDDPFLDFGASLDWYGAILFCVDCAKETVSVIGYVPQSVVTTYSRDLAMLEEHCSELEVANAKLNATLDNLLSLRPSVHSDSAASVDVDGSDGEQAEQGTKAASSGPAKSAAK